MEDVIPPDKGAVCLRMTYLMEAYPALLEDFFVRGQKSI